VIYARPVPWRALLAILVFTCAGCADRPVADVVTVTETRFIESDRTTPPDASASAWRPQALPDFWDIARRRRATQGWYRTEVTLDAAPTELWSVYLPRLCMNAAVWVNGTLVGDGGRFTEPIARNWNRPLLFTIPSRLLVAGANTVDVRLATHPAAPGFLRPFLLGPQRALQPLYARRFVAQVTVAEVVAVATLLTALMIGVVYFPRDPFGANRWFAAGVLLWGWNCADTIVRVIPVPSRLFEWSTQTAINWFAPCFVVAFHRVLDRQRPWLERLLLVHTLGGAATLALIDPSYAFFFYVAWGGVSLVIGAYLLTLIGATARTNPAGGARRLLIPSVVGLALGAHDVGAILTHGGMASVLLYPYMAPLVMLATAWTMLADLAAGLNEAERLNRELEARVREKHAELEQNYVRLRELERERAVADERDRIMRDMHDGMGGQLVSTLAMVESGRFTHEGVTVALRDALDDLRLVIDSLDPMEGDLLTILGTLRARLEPRLSRHGIRFDWRVADVPALPDLTPERVLQVLRIVQEAITNVVKHAGARTITVSTGREDVGGAPHVFVEIRDDGRGMDGHTPLGRGLANMGRRARALGAALSVESGATGTAVRLRLPVVASV
jgi:signal transduction histidine kinase